MTDIRHSKACLKFLENINLTQRGIPHARGSKISPFTLSNSSVYGLATHLSHNFRDKSIYKNRFSK
jgi:hypothetical protein